jgi:hypothetical protein
MSPVADPDEERSLEHALRLENESTPSIGMKKIDCHYTVDSDPLSKVALLRE